MIRYERDPEGGLVAVADVVVGVEHKTHRLPIGRWDSDPPAAGLANVPVVVVPDPKTLQLVLAGARRSGRNPTIRTTPSTASSARDLLLATTTDAESVIIEGGGRDALRAARALGGRALPALTLDQPELVASLFTELDVDVNVPVPSVEGSLREVIYNSLEPLKLEAMHHIVEVDPRPAFDEAGRDIRDATLNELGAAAAGVLAGRLAANRRWPQGGA